MAFPTASPGLPLALIVVTVLAVGRTSAADVVRMMPIADDAFAGSSVNVVANARQALFTHGDTQYAGFYDAAGFMVLAKRFVAAEHWETERTRYHGNVADAHNSISLAVDDAGFLHVAWDHHGNPLNYARSVAPGSLQLGPRRAMTGRREERVTYPQFHLLANGDLLFLYRDGASGNGSLVLDRYDAASRTWRMVQSDLIDGEDRRSPYWDLTIGPTGTLHLAWVWRESPDVGTNHDLAYARSADGGVTWTRTDGSRYALPITAETAEYARRIPQRHNLMNSPMIAADAADHPYVHLLVTIARSGPAISGRASRRHRVAIDRRPDRHTTIHARRHGDEASADLARRAAGGKNGDHSRASPYLPG